jgi:hypothetical protein
VVLPNVNLTNNLRPLILHGAAGRSDHMAFTCYVGALMRVLNAIIISQTGM